MSQAARACLSLPKRTSVEWNGEQLDAPHNDPTGHWATILQAFGTRSNGFVETQLGAMETSFRRRGEKFGTTPVGLNTGLAFMEAVAPANEIEAALGVQMASVHALATELLGRAKQTDRTDHIALYGGLAVKLTRTFAAQVEALAKLRSGGRQQVEVRHVYVNGNAVIGNIGAGGGGMQREQQPHAPSVEVTASAPLSGALKTVTGPVQGPGHPREEVL